MKIEMFINFDGNCKEAVEFYAKVFKTQVKNIMTYSQAPKSEEYPLAPVDKDRIMYACLDFENMSIMFMDMPSNAPLTKGDNINPTISVNDKNEVTRLFNELKEGGAVFMELQKTFFCDWYGMVQDKFGINWHIMFYNEE